MDQHLPDGAGNVAIMQEIKDILRDGKSLDPDTRDRLFLSSMIDIYRRLDALNVTMEQYKPMMKFYNTLSYLALAAAVSIMAFMGMMLTGQVEVHVK